MGFAAETEKRMEHGRDKLARKGADAIVVNDVASETTGIESDLNAATFLTANTAIELPEMTKRKLADRILDEIAALRRSRGLLVEVDAEPEAEPDRGIDPAHDEFSVPAVSRRQLIVES